MVNELFLSSRKYLVFLNSYIQKLYFIALIIETKSIGNFTEKKSQGHTSKSEVALSLSKHLPSRAHGAQTDRNKCLTWSNLENFWSKITVGIHIFNSITSINCPTYISKEI